MSRFFLLFFFLWFAFSSFFWSTDEEKQLRTLHQSAEGALKKGEYVEAKQSFGELIERIGVNTSQKYHVDWPTYVDIVLRFAEACEKIGEIEEGEKAISRILLLNPPTEQIPRITLLHARLRAKHLAPGEAYLKMREVSQRFSHEQWGKEELSYFHALEYSLNTHYDEMVRKAKRYLVSGFYNEAIALYDEILLAIEMGYYPKANLENSPIVKRIRYRLAECHYKQANYEQSIALCYHRNNNEDRIDREMLYLSALCYREKKEFDKALQLLEQYTKLGKREDLDHYDHALFEMGLFYYEAGNDAGARHYFEKLQHVEGKPKTVAALYLARLALKEKKPAEVEGLLALLPKKLAEGDLLLYECYYLRGEAAYALGAYTKALEFFERSLPPKSCEWASQALFQLGWCYLRLGEERKNLLLFSKAEEIFTKLYTSKHEECTALALGHLNQLRWTHFKDKEALEKVHSLLLSWDTVDAYLIRAAAQTHFETKEPLLMEATAERFRLSPSYGEAWYERGLSYFQEGLKNPTKGASYFEKAAWAFGHSFRTIEPCNTLKAAKLLKLEAKAAAYSNAPKSSLSLLEKLLKEFNESVEEREETLYLCGLIASYLPEPSYQALAEESLLCVAHGKGKYRDEALYLLGTLYYGQHAFEKALETFTMLAAGSSTSPFASEAWFWAGESAEKSDKSETAFALRMNVYHHYPDSPRAAEAYFRQYSYETYLGGDTTALAHLRVFPQLFPYSPFLVPAFCLLGMNEASFDKAKEAFEEGIKSFSFCLSEGKIPDPSFIHFRYQACLKLAELYLSFEQNLECALQLLHALVKDFATPDHPLTTPLKDKTPYPPLYEEGEYALVQVYLKTGKRLRAQEQLAKMLQHYQEAGVNEGLYLSHVWREQGKLAYECKDYDTALSCFEIAEEVGSGYLHEEHLLSLWLQMSHAYRGKKEYDIAMRLLSKVINTDIASPLRLKAMFHRAELYELQGRPELAVRQLEAMAKKGGDWALMAQEKLRNEYGLY